MPRPGDQTALERGLARWRRLALALPSPDAGFDLDSLLAGIFGNSAYLTDSLIAEPQVLHDLMAVGPDAALEQQLAELAAEPFPSRQQAMVSLRRAKRRLALLVALADLAGQWSVERATAALTRFADLAAQRSLALALKEAHHRGDIQLDHPDDAEAEAGIVVLGMGKLGAYELNYSSDIDLIVVFDPERLRCTGREGPMAIAVRLTRTLVYLLDQRTKDGYVFRTDLRLRPHPPGQPLALSIDDAEQYYERHGQNWERAAFIKARVIAGNREAGAGFIDSMQPFLWRKHLDYAAIRDIHSIKRQINAYRGHGEIRVAGHDIKVGRGGIREIEFFVQTQQLILGGRVPELRQPGTCDALATLAATRWLDPTTADELTEAYRFLRQVEHRLQMVADQQTHSLPKDPDGLARFAAFMGCADADALGDAVQAQLRTVEHHYAALFESSIDLGSGGALVFTGTEDDPETLTTLAQMGFSQPAPIAARVRAWHHGHIRATRDARARALLTELMPRLLQALAEQSDPVAAFERFDEFVANLPAGVQLFSLFRANPRLLGLVVNLMGIAPRLAGHLARHATLFEAMIAPDFFDPLPEPDELRSELDRTIEQSPDFQDVLDAARLWAQGREFQIGVHLLLGLTDGEAASATLTAIAETVLRAMLPQAEARLVEQHGRVTGGAFVVVGLGKLGSRELAIGSDLDLIFVYGAPPEAKSDGARPLPASTYYARLGQRLVSAISAPTAEGLLYEIDTRLRPSGNLGPVACSIENFERYQLETAQTWEHQALTRARVVAGDPELGTKAESVVRRALTKERDPGALAHEVAAMRERIFREHGNDDPWNLKHVRGGLVEAEFLAQFLQLRFAHEQPALVGANTIETFEGATAADCLAPAEGAALIPAVGLYRRLQAILRLCVGEQFSPATAPVGLRQALVRAGLRCDDLPPDRPEEFAALERMLVAAQADVGRIFAGHCAAPEPVPGGNDPIATSGRKRPRRPQ